ncbi:MAG: MFS transporter [Desertimonas sp.]
MSPPVPTSAVAAPRHLVPLVMATTLTSIMGNSLLAPLVPDILDDFGRGDSSAGLLIAAASLPGVVMAPIIGVLADRYGRRAVLAPCLLVFGVAGILIAAAPSFLFMLAARFALGLGAAGLVNLAIVLLSDHFEGEQRTRWIGINSGILTVALAVFPLLSGGLSELFGWRWSLAPQGLGVVAAIAAWRTLDRTRPADPPRLRDQLGGAGRALREPTIAASVAAAGVCFAVIFGIFLAALPNHLEDEFGLSAGWRGLVMGLPAVSASLVAFNIGRLRRRFTAGSLLIAAASVWVVAFALMGLAPALVLLGVGSLCYGLGEGAMIPSLQDAAVSRAPLAQRAAVMASWTASARLGQTVGPLAAAGLMAGPGTTAAILAGVIGAGVMLVLFAVTPLGRA